MTSRPRMSQKEYEKCMMAKHVVDHLEPAGHFFYMASRPIFNGMDSTSPATTAMSVNNDSVSAAQTPTYNSPTNSSGHVNKASISMSLKPEKITLASSESTCDTALPLCRIDSCGIASLIPFLCAISHNRDASIRLAIVRSPKIGPCIQWQKLLWNKHAYVPHAPKILRAGVGAVE